MLSVTVKNLRCEYLNNPLGIDVLEPRLSWMIESGHRGQRQTAYQILAASTPEQLDDDQGDLWDSGKIGSDQSVHVKYGGAPLTSGQRCYWKVRIWDFAGNPSAYSVPAWWEMGLLLPGDWRAAWIGPSAEAPYRPALLLRNELTIARPIKQARAYISGLGYYELSINGRRAGDHVLDPGHTNYDKRALYVTYDVTGLCEVGLNAAAVMLGQGWYGMRNTQSHETWGTPPVLYLQINIEHDDGSLTVWTSNETWKIGSGPIIGLSSYLWNNSEGEIYDARLEKEGWDAPAYDDADWSGAVEISPPAELMSAQMHEPTRVTKTLPPISVATLGPGRLIYDFGQCFSGWVELKTRGQRGAAVNMRFGELLTASGDLDEDNVYNQQNTYILKGGAAESWTPRFTYHGFRYVRVEFDPNLTSVTGLIGEWVHDDVEETGSFSCADELLNRIYEAVRWTQKSLMHSGVYEDCPHRERLGYGDGHMTTEEAIYNFGMAAFYTKWVQDWADTQDAGSGCIYHTAPYHHYSGGGPGWGSSVVLIPWDMYLYYGDTAILAKHYETMKSWVAFLASKTEGNLLQFYALHAEQPEWEFLGDWVAPRRDMTTYDWQNVFEPEPSVADGQPAFEHATGNWPDLASNVLFNSMFLYANMTIVAKIAQLLGDAALASQYYVRAEAVKHAINERFYDREKAVYGNGEQPYQAFALLLDIVPDGESGRVLDSLIRDIEEVRGGHLDTGHFGTRFLLNALTDSGREDIAYKLVSNRTFPSWGYMIEQGATTIWEQWNPHMSRIHSCFVSVGAWFYKGLGGIRMDPEAPGFQHFHVRPFFAENISFAKTTFRSMYGNIVSDWSTDRQGLRLRLEIPANSTADVYLPADCIDRVLEAGRPAQLSAGVSWLGEADGKMVFRLVSGCYHFEVKDVRR